MKNVKQGFAVLGAGNGGQAMAAYLALKGERVNIYNRSSSRLEEIKKEGGIYLEGLYEGFGFLNKITTDVKEAIEDVKFIMVVTPAVAHRYLAEQLSPHLTDGQIIILNPGRTGGALEFYNILKDSGCQADVIIAEAQTFLFASRVIGSARAKIFGSKHKVSIAALPSNRTREVVDGLFSVFPQFTPVENVLKTSLDNIGAIFHPAPTLLNMAWIESTEGKFTYYQQGITPSIAKVLEKIDEERMEVAYGLGVEPISARDWLRLSYGIKGKTLFELLQNNCGYHGINAPSSINHRYILEDVPMSLVPIASLAEMLGINTPTINMIINLANVVFETDFRETGRTVDSLGLTGLTVNEIKNLVNKGVTEEDIAVLPHLEKKVYPQFNPFIYEDYTEGYQKEVE